MKAIRYILAAVLLGILPRVQAADLKSSLNDVIRDYLDIKNELAADNSEGAARAARKFSQALAQVRVANMDAKQKGDWLKYAEKLRYDGRHIAESHDIAHQREHFGSLSANLYALVSATKTNEQTLYRQYCPMARQSWLSEFSAVKNPYLGKQMPKCGMTRETLKAAH